jgi:serine phosphatase RsbU (regulator of sigma subunit)
MAYPQQLWVVGKWPKDSLRKIINNTSLHDTTRARAMVHLAQVSGGYSDSNMALLYKADSISRKYDDLTLTWQIFETTLIRMRQGPDSKKIEFFRMATDYLYFSQKHNIPVYEAKARIYRGGAFWRYGIADKALDEITKAEDILVHTNDLWDKDYNMYLIGYYMFNSQQYKSSLQYFLRSYKMSVDDKLSRGQLAEVTGWIGNSYNALKMFDSALYYRHLSMQYADNNKFILAESYRYLGNIYQNMGALDSAMACYQRSYAMFNREHNGTRNWLLKYFISMVYYKQKNYKEAAKTIDEILDSVNGAKEPVSRFLATQMAGSVYEKNGEHDKAIKAYQDLIALKDSEARSNDAGNISEMNAKMQFEQDEEMQQVKQRQQDELARKDKQRQAIIRNVLIIGFIALMVFAGIMYRNFLQKKKANILLALQKDEIEAQKKEIQDSINYACNIQQAILPDIEDMRKSFDEFFVFYKPKNVVSGDFYWHARIGNQVFIAAVDCTGHGVPGAFMSMIGNDKLNNIVRKGNETSPGKILTQLNMQVKEALHQNAGKGDSLRDGMDIVLCRIEKKDDKTVVTYAGANRPLYIVNTSGLQEIKATKIAIGGHTEDNAIYQENVIELKKGERLYLTSDGYADQFGGGKSKKFTTRLFKETLAGMVTRPINTQHLMLEETLNEWQGREEQVDDILVIGIQV